MARLIDDVICAVAENMWEYESYLLYIGIIHGDMDILLTKKSASDVKKGILSSINIIHLPGYIFKGRGVGGGGWRRGSCKLNS